jgi:uncharacterized protein (TIGR02147 family)
MMHSPENYRRLLRQRLGELTEKNPSFSLRAFAKRIGISASHLSRVMNGKKALSLETAVQISRELGLDLTEDLGAEGSSATKPLNLDVFKVIADWYHFPLLELIKTKGFRSNEQWIAKRLGLSLALAQAALDRLESLELIERANGEIKATGENFLTTSNDIPSGAIRKHHEQMLEKGAEALNDDPKSREFQGLNLNFNPEDLPEAKEAIREFYKKFNKKFSRDSGKEVYQLNLQFFKLTRETK